MSANPFQHTASGPCPHCTWDTGYEACASENAALREMLGSVTDVQFGKYPRWANAFPWGTEGDWRVVQHEAGGVSRSKDFPNRDEALTFARAFVLEKTEAT